MRESDYILATNLARVRVMMDVSAMLTHSDGVIGETELQAIRRHLAVWETKLTQKMDQKAGRG